MRDAGRHLRRLARLHGVQCDFVDGTGRERRVGDDTLAAVLNGLGVPLQSQGDAGERLQAHRDQMRSEVLPAVSVAPAGGSLRLWLRNLPERGAYRLWTCHEAGGVAVLEGDLGDLGAGRRGRSLHLPVPGPGVHRLLLDHGGSRHVGLLLAAPVATAPGERRWGAFVPLQLLGRPNRDLVGGLDRAAAAAAWVAGLGGSFLGMLPALAGWRGETSPYSPLSRCFWSELYLAAEWLPQGCPRPPAVTSQPAAAAAEDLPPGRRIDPEGSWDAADAVVEAATRWTRGEGGASVREALLRFVIAQPRVSAYAAYRALAEVHGADWRLWPAGLADRHAAVAAADPQRVRHHLVAQWLAADQWERLASSTADAGVDLYLDLPLGVPAASFDGWWWRDELVSGCTIGAPPDRFFPEGQDWGLAPSHPQAQRRSGYEQLRAALRHHLRVARMLRVDHVMGLHRLYWVPAGASPHEGTYVRYPAAELHAVHAIEAWRRGATLVGEDLGTVPDAVRRQMRQSGMRRMWIALAEMRQDPAGALSAPPPDSLASLSTHDMPTFGGFWTDADIHRRAALGRLEGHRIEPEKAAREPCKQALLRFLESSELLSGYAPHEIAAACVRWLAASDAELLVVSPEELLGETMAINIPGAPPPGTTPAANWLRGDAGGLERCRDSEQLTDWLRSVDRLRRRTGDVAC